MDMDEVSVLVVEVENSNFVNFTQFVKEKKLPYKIKHAQCIEEVKKYLDLPINVIIIDAKLKEEEIFEIFHIISEDIFSHHFNRKRTRKHRLGSYKKRRD